MGQAKRKEEKKLSPASPPARAEEVEAQAPDGWRKPDGLSRAGWAVIAGAILLVNIPLIHHLVRAEPEASVALPYQDDFSSPSTVRDHYFSIGAHGRTLNGELLSPGAKNNPLWLKARLPQNVVVDFDVRCTSAEGDVRVEIFANGVDHLSGYELIHGGWNNSLSVIARLDEGARSLSSLQSEARQIASQRGLASAGLVETGVFKKDTKMRVEAQPFPVRPGRTYHWRIERRGSLLRWSIDGQTFLELDDPFPLAGKGHDRLGLSSNESDVYYDNLRVVPLESASAAAPPPPVPAAPATPVPAPGPSADNFERAEVGQDWLATDPSAVRIENGSLTLQRAHNHPVWLVRPLPANAVIDFDCWSESSEGDLKVEIWGDGKSFHVGDPHQQYTSTGYVFIFGGWQNTLSVIAKQHEHAANRAARPDVRVQPGRHYHWRITRMGGRISWSIDGQSFLTLDDPSPLSGPGHQFFAFSGFEAKVHFDNLRIEPL